MITSQYISRENSPGCANACAPGGRNILTAKLRVVRTVPDVPTRARRAAGVFSQRVCVAASREKSSDRVPARTYATTSYSTRIYDIAGLTKTIS